MNLLLTIWGRYLVVLPAILTLVTAQCTNDRGIQIFKDSGEILSQPVTVNRNVGDSFTIGCQRCNGKGPPNWFYSNRSTVVSCNGFNESLCVEMNENTNTSNLHFTSFTASQAGIYMCTNREVRISANLPAVVTSVSFNQLMYGKAENEGPIEFELVLNNTLTNDITVQVTSSENTATGGDDYNVGPYSVKIPAGETSGSFEISIIDDQMLESDESFDLNIDINTLPDDVTLGSPDSATVIITNDDTVDIGFEQSTYNVSEGDGSLQIAIILSNPMSRDIMIMVTGRPGTATGSDDYNSGPFDVTISAGATRVEFTVPITDDDIQEDDETFRLTIINNLSDDITFTNRITIVTIINDDIDAVTLRFNPTIYTINENNGILQPILILSAPLLTDFTLQVINIDSTANVGDGDYHPGPYSVMFSAGQTEASFDIMINNDDMLEREESFMLRINASSLPLDMITLDSNNEATVFILNDDSSVVSFSQSTYSVNENAELVQPALVLSNPSSSEITVQVNDIGITATGDDDYNSGPYFVNFPAKLTRVLFNVTIVKDNITEGNENFHLAINSSTLPYGVTVNSASDSDSEVTIVINDIDNGVQTESSSDNSSNNTTGAVVGVIVALLVMIALIIVIIILLLFYYKRKSRHTKLSEAESTDVSIDLNGKGPKTGDSNGDDESIMTSVLLKVLPKDKDTISKVVTTSLGQPTTLFTELPYSDQSEITWKKDGDPVNHLVLSDGSLYINDTGISDQGDYTVTVTDVNDATSETTRLIVIDPKMPTKVSKHLPIKVEDFPEHVALMQLDDSIRFEREYETISIEGPFSQHAAKVYANLTKNRYKNIIPHDHSRVVLTQTDLKSGRDYINASFVDGYKEARAYIAAQGPLVNTVEDFWRMVWEHNVTTIVMLTRLVENAKVKCHQYWPTSECNIYGDFKVTIKKEEAIAKFAVRTITVEKVSDEQSKIHEVHHFHYMAWPDHGVPKYGTDLLEFQKRIDKHHKRKNGTPMLVHCSAGVGRSGTFMAIDIEMQRIKHEKIVDVYNCVCRLRFWRDLMVQSEQQYELIHTALLEYITCGDTSITAPTENVQDKINKLSDPNPSTKKTGFEIQFEKLAKASPKEKEFTFYDATSSLNRKKNRSKYFIPPDSARTRLSQTDDESDYVNACSIDGYRHCNAFLVGPGPMESTLNDFWRMIWEKQSFAIVMLGQLVENGKESSFKYWPNKDNEMQLRNYVIKTTSEDNIDKDVIKRSIKITHKLTNADKTITQLQYVEWSPKSCPSNPKSMVDLIEILEHVQRKTANGPITVHCSDGMGRSGTFCALMISINRFKAEQMTDVFQTINTMRTQKPGVVANPEQYKFIHEALIAMLQRYNNYANFTVENSL